MATNMHDHWSKMKEKAAMNLANLTHMHVPQDEGEVKEAVAHALRRGTSHEAAEAVVEASEWAVAYHLCKAGESLQD